MLLNSGNTCYINSFVHAVAWMLEATGGQASDMGRGANAWRAIMSQAKAFAVTQLFPWCALQQGWRHAGRQRDVCEHIIFMLDKCQVTHFHGRWEARVMRLDGMCVTDSGTCAGTISVDPPLEGHWMLQDAINRWRLQAYVHAISEMPNWLILRINRFRQDASDGVSKIRSPMRWAARIHMPVFNDSALSFSEVSFKLRACIVHIGDDAIRGHYRALFIHDGDEVGLRYCDDGCKAKTLRTFDEVAGDVYVLFLVRENPSPH